ncbi:MAG: hypothetical protein H0V06_04975 [Gemmatimonadetes bacterium]|nr:hypothetical protein [Gemmatimonadota bacterium]
MKTQIPTTLAVILSLGASSSLTLAQTSEPRLALATSHAVASTSSYDAAAARARIAHADELSLSGHLTAARREYAAVAELQRSHNVLSAEAMWKLAELYHSERSAQRTAATLHELAMDAERFGDPELQAKALLEATILYNNARMSEKSISCAKRLDLLMASPHISDELRAAVGSRIRRT